ncbi:MAG: ribosomal-processing cysteine protease Prp [Oscillospiraceae bacterium]|jgi:uncharacterized protein YsxB (DUF464 family)|nr:ribosomal-processing cysteine protease Prp [Oscillospiraceae bacterium]
MVSIAFIYRSDVLSGFEMSGHASDSCTEGEDILCAALSSAAYLTANTITDVLGVEAEISVDDGFMRVVVPKGCGEKCVIVLMGLRLHFFALAEDYSDKINLINMEVK